MVQKKSFFFFHIFCNGVLECIKFKTQESGARFVIIIHMYFPQSPEPSPFNVRIYSAVFIMITDAFGLGDERVRVILYLVGGDCRSLVECIYLYIRKELIRWAYSIIN